MREKKKRQIQIYSEKETEKERKYEITCLYSRKYLKFQKHCDTENNWKVNNTMCMKERERERERERDQNIKQTFQKRVNVCVCVCLWVSECV